MRLAHAFAFILALLGGLLVPRLAEPHGISKSYADWTIEGAKVQARIAFAAHDLVRAIEGLDRDGDGALSAAELAARAAGLPQEVAAGLIVRSGAADDRRCKGTGGVARGRSDPVEEVQVVVRFACEALVSELSVQARLLPALEPPHVSVATFAGRGLDATHVFNAQSPRVRLTIEPPPLTTRLRAAVLRWVAPTTLSLLLTLALLARRRGRLARAGLFAAAAAAGAYLAPHVAAGYAQLALLLWGVLELTVFRRSESGFALSRRAAWALLAGAATGWGMAHGLTVDVAAGVVLTAGLAVLPWLLTGLAAASSPRPA